VKIRVGDTVQIITGKDKGKKGKVLKTFRNEDKVVVEGINLVTKHLKPGPQVKEGGIVSIEKAIHVSNVMYFDDKANRPTKIKMQADGKKYIRASKASGDKI